MVSKSLGDDIHRKENHFMLIYLIDYENEDSVALLKNFIEYKKQVPLVNYLILYRTVDERVAGCCSWTHPS